MEHFGEILKEVMRQKKVSVPALAKKTDIKPATLRSYLSGERNCKEENLAQILKALLPESTDEYADLERRCLEAVRQPNKRLTWFEKLSVPDAELRYLPFNYPPITDGHQYFLDKLLRRLFTLAVIRESQGDRGVFDMKRRADAVWQGKADMLTGLCTLPRLKLLHYYLVPIRVSIGAVIHKRHKPQIKELRKALAGKISFPAKVIAVEGEVGQIYVTQSTRLKDSVVLVGDLDPELLAKSLMEQQESEDAQKNGVVPLVCCDEITAMRVLAELKEQGCLIFPPSTPDSIRECEERKELPAHFAGFAVSRGEPELIQYLDDAFNLLLETEVEAIAQNWAGGYKTLFDSVCGWLHEGLGDSSIGADRTSEREFAERRVARDYARRVFRLTRDGIESCRQHHSSWINILKRAREIVQRETSRQRIDIRNRVLDIAASYFGMPVEWTAVNINQLLATAANDSTFAAEFRHSLAGEFDIEPASELAAAMKINHLEGIISFVQRSLESDSGLFYSARVMPVSAEQFERFKELLGEFEDSLKVKPSERLTDELLTPYFSSPENSVEPARIVLFVAQKQQIHGFLMMTGEQSGSMRLERLFVRKPARGAGLGSQLVRRGIEISAELNCARVFMNPLRFNSKESWDDENTRRLKALLSHEGFSSANERGELFEYVIRSYSAAAATTS